MVVLSLFLHLSVFSIILFVPQSIPSGRIKGIVYEVNLVEMPVSSMKKQMPDTVQKKKEETIIQKNTPTRRIQAPAKKEKPLVVAKRTATKKNTQIEKPDVTPSKLIDKAISKIEKKVKAENSSHFDKAISSLEKKVGASSDRDSVRGGPLNGILMRLYQVEVENWVKSNWSYPIAIQNQKKLEAIVLVKVKQDGTILESTFKKRSKDTIFDQSVLKAIEKSDPLPPFPEGYIKSYDEIEINFNLKDLEDN